MKQHEKVRLIFTKLPEDCVVKATGNSHDTADPNAIREFVCFKAYLVNTMILS